MGSAAFGGRQPIQLRTLCSVRSVCIAQTHPSLQWQITHGRFGSWTFGKHDRRAHFHLQFLLHSRRREKENVSERGYTRPASLFPRRAITTTEYNALSLPGLCQFVAHFLLFVLLFCFCRVFDKRIPPCLAVVLRLCHTLRHGLRPRCLLQADMRVR